MATSLREIVNFEPQSTQQSTLNFDDHSKIFSKLEKLEEENTELSQRNYMLEQELQMAEHRIDSILTDNQRLEGIILKVDDSAMQSQMELQKQQITSNLKEKFTQENEMLTTQIRKIEQHKFELEMFVKDLQNELEMLKENNKSFKKKNEVYHQDYVPKQKLESMSLKLGKFRTANDAMDSKILFRDIKVRELEKKIALKEENHRKKMKEIREKMQSKLTGQQKILQQKINKLVLELENVHKFAKAQKPQIVPDETNLKRLESKISRMQKKEKNLTDRLFRITFNFKKLEEQREKKLKNMEIELQKKNSEIFRLEKTLSKTIQSSRLMATQSQFTSKKSVVMMNSVENQSNIYLNKILELEKTVNRMKIQNRVLFEDLIDSKRRFQEENTIMYSVFVSTLRP